MSEPKSALGRLWSGFWALIDNTRRVVVNVLFLAVIVLVLYWIFNSGDRPVVSSGSALVLSPSGVVVEEYSGSALDRAIQQATAMEAPETRLRDMVRAVRRAADDDSISVLLIRPDRMWGIGLASLRELEKAVEIFRASGKPVIAMGNGLAQHPYYLASMADEVWLNPHGYVWVDGYAAFRNYYKEGLDKLEVDINLFRAGEFKSAREPYTRNDMSEAAKEANLYWIGGNWQHFLEGVSRHRGIPLETLSASINNMPELIEAADGDFAALAMNMGLADRLLSEPEFRQELAIRGVAADGDGELRTLDFRDYLRFTDRPFLPLGRDTVAVVVAEGEILQGEQPPGIIGGTTLATRLRQVGRDNNVAAVVLRVDSPGGDPFASEIIRRELQAIRESGKPVVVSMGDVAASGGYWISMAADEVWASPATITGSIGVIGMIPTFQNTLQKIGVHTDGVGTTPLAGRLRVDMPLDDGIRRIFQASVENTYDNFISLVARQRELPEDTVRAIAEGRVWNGTQAAERGLVDRTGTLQEALDSAARIAGLGDDYSVNWIEPEYTAFEQFMLDISQDASLPTAAGKWSVPGVHLPLAARVIEDLHRLVRSADQFTVAAHCMCGIE